MNRLLNILIALALALPVALVAVLSPSFALADDHDWENWTAYRGEYDDWGEHLAAWWREHLEYRGAGQYDNVVHDTVFVEVDRKSGLIAMDDYCFLPVEGKGEAADAEYTMFVRLNDSFEELGVVSAGDDVSVEFVKEAIAEMDANAAAARGEGMVKVAALAGMIAVIAAGLFLFFKLMGRKPETAEGQGAGEEAEEGVIEIPVVVFTGWRAATVAAAEAEAAAREALAKAGGKAVLKAVPGINFPIPTIEPVVELSPEGDSKPEAEEAAEPETETKTEPEPVPEESSEAGREAGSADEAEAASEDEPEPECEAALTPEKVPEPDSVPNLFTGEAEESAGGQVIEPSVEPPCVVKPLEPLPHVPGLDTSDWTSLPIVPIVPSVSLPANAEDGDGQED